MNAIPQRAHNYERIPLPHTNGGGAVSGGRISDMEAYRMQKIAEQRRRLQQRDDEEYVRIYDRKKRDGHPRQQRQPQQQRQQPVQQRRQAAPTRVYEQSTPIRQTGVKNMVGGRNLTPAYEGASSAGAYQKSYAQRAREVEQYYNTPNPNRIRTDRERAEEQFRYDGRYRYSDQRYEASTRSRYDQAGYYDEKPRQAMHYAGYTSAPRRKLIHGFDMDESRSGSREANYSGVKPIAVEYTNQKKKGVVSTILLIAFVFALLSGIVIRYAGISNVNYQNSQIESNITELSGQLDKLKMDIALKDDLNSIQQRATQLGMGYPTEGQIVYVNPADDEPAVSTPDTSAVAATGDDVQTVTGTVDTSGQAQESQGEGFLGFLNSIFNGLKGLFEK